MENMNLSLTWSTSKDLGENTIILKVKTVKRLWDAGTDKKRFEIQSPLVDSVPKIKAR